MCRSQFQSRSSFHQPARRRQPGCCYSAASSTPVEVDVNVEGELLQHTRQEVDALLDTLQSDAERVLRTALQSADAASVTHELSVVLCDDDYIQELNKQWRQKDSPTDVLSFPMDDGVPDGLPCRVLGDIIISLDTAARQAAELGHPLLQECRVLLVHGMLHLLGFDHELGQQEAADMSTAEADILQRLGWQGTGLVAAAEARSGASNGKGDPQPAAATQSVAARQPRRRPAPSSGIKLLALDMDGTTLDSRSRVLPSTVDALRAAMARGVTVMAATGKARPAAFAAWDTVGLAGEGLVISNTGPGVFLQGLAVHDLNGLPLASRNVPQDVVVAAFKYAAEHNVPLSAFLGDVCVTLKMAPELEELHTRYFEPLSEVVPSLADIQSGPPVKKLLFMTDSSTVERSLKPHWEAALTPDTGAQTTQAVETMLEIVPHGMHKWVGMDVLLKSMRLTAEQVMTIGDGSNDLQLVLNAGIGVAMANGVDEVKAAATFVTASNDDDGVALAIEKFLL